MTRRNIFPALGILLFATAALYLFLKEFVLGIGMLAALGALVLVQWGDRILPGKEINVLGLVLFPLIIGLVGFRWFESSMPLVSWTALVGGVLSSPILFFFWRSVSQGERTKRP